VQCGTRGANMAEQSSYPPRAGAIRQATRNKHASRRHSMRSSHALVHSASTCRWCTARGLNQAHCAQEMGARARAAVRILFDVTLCTWRGLHLCAFAQRPQPALSFCAETSSSVPLCRHGKSPAALVLFTASRSCLVLLQVWEGERERSQRACVGLNASDQRIPSCPQRA